MNILLEKYRWFAFKLTVEYLEKYPNFEYIRDELHAVAFYNTYPLVKTYVQEKGFFYAYWKKSALRSMEHYIKVNVKDVGASSLDFVPSNTVHELHDIVGFEDKAYEKELLNEAFTRIIEDKYNDFSKREKAVIKLFLDGYEISEIAELLGCSLQTVYRNYHQAVEKIGRVLKGLYK